MISQQPAAIPMALGVYNPGTKEEQAAEMKQLVRYAPGEGCDCCWNLLDLARVTLVFPSYRALQASLDAFIKSEHFDVVLVRNFFHTPSRLGSRHIDVYVAFPVPGADGSGTLHICEVRFEEQSWFKARLENAATHIEGFFDAFRRTLSTMPGVDLDLASHLAHAVLASQPETAVLKHFRRSVARQQPGSSVDVWRDLVPGRRLDFACFKDMCCALGERSLKEHAAALWTELDPGYAGCISLFDFDAEAATTLKRFRDRVLTLADGEDEGLDLQAKANDRLDAVWRGVVALIQPQHSDRLDHLEFVRLAQGLGVAAPEATRVQAYLDKCRLDQRGHGPVFVRDIDLGWLLSLDRLVDLGAACLESEDRRRLPSETSDLWGICDSFREHQRGWNFTQQIVDPSVLMQPSRSQRQSEGGSEPMKEPEGEDSPGLQRVGGSRVLSDRYLLRRCFLTASSGSEPRRRP
jgi:hypothetical protein